MPIAKDDNYLITLSIDAENYIPQLHTMSALFNDISRNLGKGELSDFFSKLSNSVARMSKKRTLGVVENIVKDAGEKILSNIMSRFAFTFSKTTGRYHDALERGFSIKRYKMSVSVSLVNTEILDAATSIFFKKSGEPYEPPQTYGDITAYWRFHEFTGAGPRLVFKKPDGYWARVLYGTGGFERHNIILTVGFSIYDEDYKIWLEAKQRIAQALLQTIRANLK
jgi:hypothetical protein